MPTISPKRLLLASAVLAGVTLTIAHLGQPAAAGGQVPSATESGMPQKILVHITHGPEHPTRSALGFAVARAALEQGHDVSIFLAGDGVQLIREGVLDNLAGLGTGNMRELYDGIVADGGRLYLSGGSSRARSVTNDDLAGKPAEFAGPSQLVTLALEHDRMFTY